MKKSLLVALVVFSGIFSAACGYLLTGVKNGQNGGMSPEPALIRWHSENGLILKSHSNETYYLVAAPGAVPVVYNQPDAVPTPDVNNERFQISPSGKYAAKTVIGQQNSSCCAVLTGLNKVSIYEVANPANEIVLSEIKNDENGKRQYIGEAENGDKADWYIRGWTADDRAVIFQNRGVLFLLDRETREKTPLKTAQQFNLRDFQTTNRNAGAFISGGDYYGSSDKFDRASSSFFLEYLDFSTLQSVPLLKVPSARPDFDQLAVLSPDQSKLALLLKIKTANGDQNKLYLFDAATRTKTGEYDLPEGALRDAVWNPNNQEIAFRLWRAEKQVEIHSVKTNGELKIWFKPAANE